MSGAETCRNPQCPDYGFIHEGSCGLPKPDRDSPAARELLALVTPAPQAPTPPPASGDREVRVKALELMVEHFKDARINGRWLSPEDLISRAAKLEAYIKDGASVHKD